MAFQKHRDSSTRRGLGYAHKQARQRLIPAAIGTLCPYLGIDPKCPGMMRSGDQLDLDHIVARCVGGSGEDSNYRVAHHMCNLRAGARLAGKLSRQKSRPSRLW